MQTTANMMESKQSIMHLERAQALETWQQITKTKLTQVNGQRKYGGPPEVWTGPTPGAHCEIFISQIPRDAYEDLLIPLFSSVGPLWEFRLMMNFSGETRGFAFAKYGSPAAAAEAVHLLHGHMLEPGCFLKVRPSVEKRRLCIGHLPADIRQEDLSQVLRSLADGVVRVSLTAERDIIEGVSATVVFSSHYAASMAKKMLVQAFRKLFALTVSVHWHETLPPPKQALLPCLNPPNQRNHTDGSPKPPVLRSIPPSAPAGFSKTVGGPIHTPRTSTFSSSSRGDQVSAGSPVMLLRNACEESGFGKLDMSYSHTGWDGFIYFTYSLRIPGITAPFKGLVPVLPEPSITTVLIKARQAAAQQVLQRLASLPTDGLIRDQ